MDTQKNKVQLIGHLRKAPEMTREEGQPLKASLSLETVENVILENRERGTLSQFHKVVCLGKLAERAESFLDYGSEIAIEGKLTYRHYTTSKGILKWVTEIEAWELLILSGKKV
jgi:single-strand DNA-binding protein